MPVTLEKPRAAPSPHVPSPHGGEEASASRDARTHTPSRGSPLSRWWALASDDDKISRLAATDDPLAADLRSLAIESADTASEDLFRQIFRFLVHEVTCKERMPRAEGQLLGRRIAGWLQSEERSRRLLGETLLRDWRVVEGLGDAGGPIAQTLLERVCQSRPAHRDSPVRRAAFATRVLIRSRNRQAGAVARALMASPLPDSALGPILQSILEGEPLDLCAALPGTQRKEFQSWLSREILRLRLDALFSIHPTWIATDPALTAQRLELQPLLTPASAIAAALHWPTAYMPQLLARFEHYPDESLWPILEAAARNHSRAIPSHLLPRLRAPKHDPRVAMSLAPQSVAGARR